MFLLILAAEASTHEPAGDDFATIAFVMLGIVMLIAAIAAWRVTPRLTHD